MYELDQNGVKAMPTKSSNGISIKYFTKNRRHAKNFENVNFQPFEQDEEEGVDDSVQMDDVYGGSIVDEYPGDDDDQTPII